MNDPTKCLPWKVEHREADLGPFRFLSWCVVDSTGKILFAFPPIPDEKTDEQCEALARMIAAGSEAEKLRDAVEQLAAALGDCLAYLESPTVSFGAVEKSRCYRVKQAAKAALTAAAPHLTPKEVQS